MPQGKIRSRIRKYLSCCRTCSRERSANQPTNNQVSPDENCEAHQNVNNATEQANQLGEVLRDERATSTTCSELHVSQSPQLKGKSWITGLTNAISTSALLKRKLEEQNGQHIKASDGQTVSRNHKFNIGKAFGKFSHVLSKHNSKNQSISSSHESITKTNKMDAKHYGKDSVSENTEPNSLSMIGNTSMKLPSTSNTSHATYDIEDQLEFEHFVKMFSKVGVNIGTFRMCKVLDNKRRQIVVEQRKLERQRIVDAEYAAMRAKLPVKVSTKFVEQLIPSVLAAAVAKRAVILAEERRLSLQRKQEEYRRKALEKGLSLIGFVLEFVLDDVHIQTIQRKSAVQVLSRFWRASIIKRSVALQVAAKRETRFRKILNAYRKEWHDKLVLALGKLQENRKLILSEQSDRLKLLLESRSIVAPLMARKKSLDAIENSKPKPYKGHVALCLPQRTVTHRDITVLPATTEHTKGILDWIAVPVGVVDVPCSKSAAKGAGKRQSRRYKVIKQPLQSKLLGLEFSQDRVEPRKRIDFLSSREEYIRCCTPGQRNQAPQSIIDNVQSHQPNLGDARHTQQPNVGDARHTQQSNVGDARHTQQSNVGDARHTQQPNVGDARHTQQSNVDDARHTQQSNVDNARDALQSNVDDARNTQSLQSIINKSRADVQKIDREHDLNVPTENTVTNSSDWYERERSMLWKGTSVLTL